MTMHHSAPAQAGAPAAHTATIGDELRVLQRPNGSKASRALAEVKQAGDVAKILAEDVGEFIRDYESKNFVELDRAQARFQYPPRPIFNEDGGIIVEPDDLENGDPNPRAGEPVLLPSRIDRMTDADWAAAGNGTGKLHLPQSPTQAQIIAAVAPRALELAEDRVYRLLALFLMENREVKELRKAGTLDDILEERAQDLLGDAYADEILELAVVCGELVDHHFRRKASALGDRVGNALRLIGLGPEKTTTPSTPSTTPESTTPTSPSDSPEHSDGTPTPSTDSPTTSSSASATASTPSEPSTNGNTPPEPHTVTTP